MGQTVGSFINLAQGTPNKAAGQIIQSDQGAQGIVNGAQSTATGDVTGAAIGANNALSGALSTQETNLSPYTAAGTTGLGNLQSEISSLSSPGNQFSFTPQQYANDPSFQFQTATANQAQERSAAAGGGLGTGGEQKALGALDTGLASTYLDSAFNRSLATYNTNRQNTLSQIQANTGLVNTGLTGTNIQNSDIGNTAAAQAGNTLNAATYAGNTGIAAANTNAGLQTQIGQATAAGTLGTAQNLTNGIGGAVNGAIALGTGLYNGGNTGFGQGSYNYNPISAAGAPPSVGSPSGQYYGFPSSGGNTGMSIPPLYGTGTP